MRYILIEELWLAGGTKGNDMWGRCNSMQREPFLHELKKVKQVPVWDVNSFIRAF